MAQMILQKRPLLLREYPEPIEQRSVKGPMGRRGKSNNLSGGNAEYGRELLDPGNLEPVAQPPVLSANEGHERTVGKAQGSLQPPSQKPFRQNRLRPVSPKRAKQNQEYERVKKRWWAARLETDNGQCQFTDDLRHVRCLRPASRCPHHVYGRGKYLCNSATFLAICAEHHAWIHDNMKAAEERGYVVRTRSL